MRTSTRQRGFSCLPVMGLAAALFLLDPVPASANNASAAGSSPLPLASQDEQRAILQALAQWASAWSARDVSTYLNHYSPDFQPNDGISRAAWAEHRRRNIENKRFIQVRVLAPEVIRQDGAAAVIFEQDYRSDRLTERSKKTLMMVKRSGKWLIFQERSEALN